MIGNPKNITLSTGLPVEQLRKIDYSQFTSAFLVNRDLEFTDIVDFMDQDTWIAAIKSRFIFPLLGIREVADKSEDTNYQKSKLRYNYKAYDGRYIYEIRFAVPIDYVKILNQFDGQEYSIIFADINRYIYAYTSDGTKIKALDTNLLGFNKMKMGEATAAFTTLTVELSNSEQINRSGVIQKVDWEVNNTEIIFISITNIESTGSTNLSFIALDEIYGCPIKGLNDSVITLVDDTGTQTIGNIQEYEGGIYLLTGITPGITFGQIVIDTGVYYGLGTYIFDSATVEMSNFSYYSIYSFTFDVRNTVDSGLVTGLLVTDFVVTDDINGILTPGSFTEVSTGRYELASLSDQLTTGDIAVIDTVYTGTTPYDLVIDVTITNLISETDISFNMDIHETLSGDPVVTLASGAWTVTDTDYGVLPVSGSAYNGSGNRDLDVSFVRGSGLMEISSDRYSGSITYDFIQANFLNGGASDTTDWLNPTAGVGEYWTQPAPLTYKAASIVNGNGFTGNTQRVESLVGDNNLILLTGKAIYYKSATTYQLSFMYRSDRTVEIRVKANAINYDYTTPLNIGNATAYLSPAFTTDNDAFLLELEFMVDTLVSESGYLEIDEIELIEV